MKKIEAIIRHERLQEVQDALDQLGVSGLTVSEVVGCGRQKGYTEQYRGVRANISLLPKIKVESVVPSDIVDSAVEAIVRAARRATSETGACSSTRSSSRSGSAPARAARTACATRSPWAGGTYQRRIGPRVTYFLMRRRWRSAKREVASRWTVNPRAPKRRPYPVDRARSSFSPCPKVGR